MRAFLLAPGLAFFLALAAVLSGCGGTETGNPQAKVASSPYDGGAPLNESQKLLNAICLKLSTCSNASYGLCVARLPDVTNIDSEIGLAPNFGSFQFVMNSEAVGAITPNLVRSLQCRQDLNALSCSDLSVTSAYDPGNTDDFSKVYKLIPTGGTSCAGIFSP